MAKTRITHKRKVYNPDDHNIWIEVERLDTLIIETGIGFHYQKTIYNFLWENEQDDGTWDGSDQEGRTTVKRITNPDNNSQWVDLPVINKVTVETGRGFAYRKTVLHFDNTDENETRVTHVKTVRNPDDLSMSLKVEVIEKLTHELGRGFAYQKGVFTFEDQGDEQGA